MRKVLVAALIGAITINAPAIAQTTAGDTPTTVVVEAGKPAKHHGTHTWVRGESAHFIIYSNAPLADARTVIMRLEQFHALLRFLGDDTGPEATGPKLELYYVAHPDSLTTADPAPPAYAIGLYKSCEEGVQAYATDMYDRPESKTPLEKRPENEGMVYIFDAYAHHYLAKHDSHRTPAWFIDGLASYTSTARFDDNKAVVGMAPAAYATYLPELSYNLTYSLGYKDVLNGADSKPGLDADDATKIRNEFEARAWLLTHWIMSNPQNRAKLGAYFDAVSKDAAPVDAFQQAYGLTPSRLDYTLWTYLKGQHVLAAKLGFTVPAIADINFETLPDSADKLVLWRAALKACPTAAHGPGLLSDVTAEAAKYPQSELAQTTLSRAQIAWGDPHAALPYLTRTATATPGDAEVQYLLGRARLAVAQSETGDGRAQDLSAAEQAFMKASDDDPETTAPDAAANAWFYARAELLSHDAPSDAALSATMFAWRLAPEVDDYALAAGLALAHMGRTPEALHVLHTVADDPHGRSLTPLAKAWIARLSAGVSDADIVAALKAGFPAPEGGLAQWTLASQQVLAAQDRAAADEEMDERASDALMSGDSPVPGM